MRILCVLLVALVGCSQEGKHPMPLEITGFTMGTRYSIKINELTTYHLPKKRLKTRIEALLQDINQKMSTYITDSELMRLNHDTRSSWITISDELFYVIHQAIVISRQTEGLFDITIGPLVNLWGFGNTPSIHEVPSEHRVHSISKNIGYQLIELNPVNNTIRKQHPDIFIDLSAIAKGYAVDRLTTLLLSMEFRNFMVEIGGEIRAYGTNQDAIPWQIGIERPDANKRAVQEIIGLRDMGMATSGDYRNFTEIDKVAYSHILDPDTGKPISHHLSSVTILHPLTMYADALATAILVMGKDRALDFVERYQIPALLIYRTEQGFKSSHSSAWGVVPKPD